MTLPMMTTRLDWREWCRRRDQGLRETVVHVPWLKWGWQLIDFEEAAETGRCREIGVVGEFCRDVRRAHAQEIVTPRVSVCDNMTPF